MDHRGTMNTEKTNYSQVDFRSLIGDVLEQMLAFVFSVFIVSLWSSRPFPMHRYG